MQLTYLILYLISAESAISSALSFTKEPSHSIRTKRGDECRLSSRKRISMTECLEYHMCRIMSGRYTFRPDECPMGWIFDDHLGQCFLAGRVTKKSKCYGFKKRKSARAKGSPSKQTLRSKVKNQEPKTSTTPTQRFVQSRKEDKKIGGMKPNVFNNSDQVPGSLNKDGFTSLARGFVQNQSPVKKLPSSDLQSPGQIPSSDEDSPETVDGTTPPGKIIKSSAMETPSNLKPNQLVLPGITQRPKPESSTKYSYGITRGRTNSTTEPKLRTPASPILQQTGDKGQIMSKDAQLLEDRYGMSNSTEQYPSHILNLEKNSEQSTNNKTQRGQLQNPLDRKSINKSYYNKELDEQSDGRTSSQRYQTLSYDLPHSKSRSGQNESMEPLMMTSPSIKKQTIDSFNTIKTVANASKLDDTSKKNTEEFDMLKEALNAFTTSSPEEDAGNKFEKSTVNVNSGDVVSIPKTPIGQRSWLSTPRPFLTDQQPVPRLDTTSANVSMSHTLMNPTHDLRDYDFSKQKSVALIDHGPADRELVSQFYAHPDQSPNVTGAKKSIDIDKYEPENPHVNTTDTLDPFSNSNHMDIKNLKIHSVSLLVSTTSVPLSPDLKYVKSTNWIPKNNAVGGTVTQIQTAQTPKDDASSEKISPRKNVNVSDGRFIQLSFPEVNEPKIEWTSSKPTIVDTRINKTLSTGSDESGSGSEEGGFKKKDGTFKSLNTTMLNRPVTGSEILSTPRPLTIKKSEIEDPLKTEILPSPPKSPIFRSIGLGFG